MVKIAIPATKNFELEKHRFFEGIFSNSRLGRGGAFEVAFGDSGRDFAKGLQVHKKHRVRAKSQGNLNKPLPDMVGLDYLSVFMGIKF